MFSYSEANREDIQTELLKHRLIARNKEKLKTVIIPFDRSIEKYQQSVKGAFLVKLGNDCVHIEKVKK